MNLLLTDNNHDEEIAALVVKATEGDERAFEKLFWLCHHGIYKYLQPKIRNDEDTADILQDTFLAAWKNLRDLHDPASFRAWLYRIARNKALNHLRHEKIVSRLLWRWKDPDTPIVIAGQSPHEWILLNLALEKVNPTYRECLILREIHGLSKQEIANILDISEDSVNTYVYRSLMQLRLIYKYLDILFRMKGL